jgi:lysozyme
MTDNSRVCGIDVSHYNGEIDWDRVADSNIRFAFAKASQGADSSQPFYTDPMFAVNWPKMKAAGLVRGAYHFVGLPMPGTPKEKWNDDLHREIDHFLDVIGTLEPEDFPPALDFEDGDSPGRWKQLLSTDRAGALSIVRELIQYTFRQCGVLPVIYTGNFWWQQLGDPDPVHDNLAFGEAALWFAQYPVVNDNQLADFGALTATQPRHIPKVWGSRWNFWQFSSKGKLAPALAGNFDLDVFNGTLDDLKKLTIGAAPPIT